MFAALPAVIRVPLVLLIIAASTLLHVLPLVLLSLLRAVLPGSSVGRALGRLLESIAESWIGVNSFLIDHFTQTRVVVEGADGLVRQRTYLVLANHQSWVDIPVLQKALNRRIPLLRFFLKRQLFWVPVLGLAWWALDFPFMRRHSREEIAARPELALRDLETTRRACAKFRQQPVSVMNFVEGTRASESKLAAQASADPALGYRHLLRPKAGGVAFVLGSMGDVLDELLDVTVVYPAGRGTLWEFLTNRIPVVRVVVKRLPLPAELLDGDYEGDADYRRRFQDWVNALWQAKDEAIDGLLASEPAA